MSECTKQVYIYAAVNFIIGCFELCYVFYVCVCVSPSVFTITWHILAVNKGGSEVHMLLD